jgi:cathepsin D
MASQKSFKFLSFFLLFLISFSLANEIPENVIELNHADIPFDEKIDFFNQLEHVQTNLNKYTLIKNKLIGNQPRFVESTFLKKFKKILLHLTNYKNSQYIGSVLIGNPPQKMDIIFDTGSSNFWVTSVRCKDPGCLIHKGYDGKKSKSYKPLKTKVQVEFGSGKVQGIFSQDTIKFGPLVIKNQEFGEILREEGPIFLKLKFAGILGLSFPSLSSLKHVPIFDNIMKSRRLTKNWFSFYLTDQNEKGKSQIILGKPPRKFYKNKIVWHRVTEPKYWQISMDDIYVNGKPLKICKKKCKIVLDSGTSIMTGPSDKLDKLLNKIKLDTNNCHKLTHLPTITFRLGGINYSLKPKEYLLFAHKTSNANMFSRFLEKNSMKNKTKRTVCQKAFMPLDVDKPRGPLWVLGDVFMRKYFVIFDRDKKRIGIAERRKNVN